ncbi:hypothetical protein JXI42_11165 [bacterium]|nr:hypothetical protein [bacterium]
MKKTSLFLFLVVLSGSAFAVPGIMNYNGKLTTLEGLGVNDTVDFIFGIYNHAAAGILLWDEIQNNIPVQRGLFDVKLGRINPIELPFDQTYWLEIIVNGDTLSPRVGLASAPYAFRAAYADSVEGTFKDDDWDRAGNMVFTMYPADSIGIGTPTPAAKLEVMGDTRIQGDLEVTGQIDPVAVVYQPQTTFPLPAEEGKLYYDNNINSLRVYDSTGWVPLKSFRRLRANAGWLYDSVTFVPGPNIVIDQDGDTITIAALGGAGDNDWTVVGDNLWSFPTGNVGIGAIPPLTKLQVQEQDSGDIFSAGTPGDTKFIIKNDGNVGIGVSSPIVTLAVYEEDSTTDPLKVSADGTTRMIIKNDGDVGIGTSSPSARLDVGYSSTDVGDIFKVSDAGTARLVVDEDGEVGIGTATPEAKVHVYRGASGETPTDVHGIFIENSGTSNSAYVFQTATAGGGKSFSITNLGRIGIGTDSPEYNVHLLSPGGLATICVTPDTTPSGGSSKIILGEDDDFTYGMGIKYDGPTNRLFVYGKSDADIYNNHLSINRNNGWIGMGTDSPDAVLHVAAGSDDAFKVVGSGSTRMIIKSDGKVAIGHDDPQAKLDVRTKILVTDSDADTLVEIGAGLDYAEGFNVTDHQNVTPGMVLCIDPENPGKLVASSAPYDKRVAGIVAGANNLGSAVKIGSSEFDHNVALAGRVYCNVDASQGTIEPGDLLTTSSILGYAMKVIDPERAQGAVLGKAMEPLEKGKKGQILVLVTLQ